MNDALGDRMKQQFENRTRYHLPRRTYTIVRVDGRAFHTYCRDLERPFDAHFAEDMDHAALCLCQALQGARLAYVQSDEISVLLTDFDQPSTEGWFDGNIQKIASLSASTATAAFNMARLQRQWAALQTRLHSTATFDGRVFTIPDPTEVFNYFVWRQKDATRNSISMAAQAHFSHKQLQGVDTNQMQELLWSEKHINWSKDYPDGFKRGRVLYQTTSTSSCVTYIDKRTGETRTVEDVMRSEWSVLPAPDFVKDRAWLLARIPMYAAVPT